MNLKELQWPTELALNQLVSSLQPRLMECGVLGASTALMCSALHILQNGMPYLGDSKLLSGYPAIVVAVLLQMVVKYNVCFLLVWVSPLAELRLKERNHTGALGSKTTACPEGKFMHLCVHL